MNCPRCITHVSDDSHYCPQCGEPTLLTDDSRTQVFPANAAQVVAETLISQSLAASPAAPRPVEIDPEKIHTQLTMANLCRIRREWSEAVEHCVAVLQMQPGNATAHSLLGDIYRDQGKLDDAIQWVRMAVDIKPNPSDLAKLQKMEAERTRLIGAGNALILGDGTALSGDADAGTTRELMGVSPRRWLNGMTLASAGFLGAVIVVLLLMRGGRPAAATRTASNPNVSYGSPAPGSGILPPAAPLPRGGSYGGNVPAQIASGAGLPPDKGTNGSTAARTPRTPAAPGGQNNSVPPAPVLGVRPAPAAPAPSGQAHSGGDATALPGDMNIARVQPGTNSAKVVIDASVSSVADIRPDVHDMMIRNVYRAARSVFAAYGKVSSVAVTVQARSNDALLLNASVDRAVLSRVDPDSTPLENLEDSLPTLRWADTLQR